MSFLYHYLTAPPDTSLPGFKEHFEQVKRDGVLLANLARERRNRSCFVSEDPYEDRKYVFLSPDRFIYEWLCHSLKKTPEVRYGFKFEADSLRGQPGVLWREYDPLREPCSSPKIEPFLNQELLEENEVLVFGMLDLNLAVAEFIEGVEHVRFSQNACPQDSHKQATHCSGGGEEQGLHQYAD